MTSRITKLGQSEGVDGLSRKIGPGHRYTGLYALL